jgi:hypothetical protein
MDPATLAIGVGLIADVVQTMQQYQGGTITQEQAHAQFLAAFDNLKTAISQFEAAVRKPA